MVAMVVLSGEGLCGERGDRIVFSDLSFAVTAGTALLIRGPNGAGKSTLLRLLAGLGRPRAGRVRFNGQDVREDPETYRRHIGYLGHRDGLKAGLTVTENLRFWTRLAGRPATDATIAAALERMEIARLRNLPVRLLSAGQRQRVALVRVGLGQAPVWLLDEPTVGLDSAAQRALIRDAAAHQAGGGIVIAATHGEMPLNRKTDLALRPPAGGRKAAL